MDKPTENSPNDVDAVESSTTHTTPLNPLKTWDEVIEHKSILSILYKDRKIAFKEIADDITSRLWDAQFEKQKNDLPDKAVYKIWEVMFLKREEYSKEYELEGLSNVRKEEIAEKKKHCRKYLTSLTNHVLAAYRDTFIISDRFLLGCFSHSLESVLYFIEENEKFFKFSLSTTNLCDLYILLSIDTNNMTIFMRYIKNFDQPHLEYAITFATIDFLMMVWKSRKYIPDFDTKMTSLESSMKGKDWKQHRFFDWWRNHR